MKEKSCTETNASVQLFNMLILSEQDVWLTGVMISL